MNKAVKFFASLMLVLLTAPAFAQNRIDVVKIINFSCAFCRATEVQDSPIAQQVVSQGGVFAYAALPADGSTFGRELLYYAARNAYPAFDSKIREIIFKGVQEDSAPLEDPEQSVKWFMTKELGPYVSEEVLLKKVKDPATEESVVKAINITLAVGASQVPTYVILKNGQVDSAFDITAVRGASYLGLKELVIDKIKSLNK